MTVEPPKLPIWRTARETYALIFGNLGFLLRSGLPWLLLAVALLVGLDWVKLQIAGPASTSLFAWRELISSLAQSVLQIASLAPFAVYWHRHVLQAADERHVPELRLILAYGLAAFLMEAAYTASVWLPIEVWPSSETTSGWLTALLVFAFVVLMIAGAYLWGRITLILPAIALGRDRSLNAAWSATRGNGWQLLWSSLVTFLPLLLGWIAFYFGRYAVLSIGQPEGAEPEPATTVPTATTPVWDLLDSIQMNLIWVFFALLAISFLSVAYRELVLKRDHASAP